MLILSDVPADALSDVQWDAVSRLVRERGGSLFLLAGPDHLPASYTPSDDHRIRAAAVRRPQLLPDLAHVARRAAGVPLRAGAAACRPRRRTRFASGPGAGNLRHWQELPGVFRFMPVPELNPRLNTRALLVEADSRLPVLTESLPGNGRVFFLGTNETGAGGTRSAGGTSTGSGCQLIRYAAGEPYAVQRATLALDVDGSPPRRASAFTVRARVLEPDARRLSACRCCATAPSFRSTRLRPPAGRRRRAVHRDGRGLWPRAITSSAWSAPRDATATLEVPCTSRRSTEAEMADVSGDPDLLRRIAEASGGQMLTARPARRTSRPARGDRHDRIPVFRMWHSGTARCCSCSWSRASGRNGPCASGSASRRPSHGSFDAEFPGLTDGSCDRIVRPIVSVISTLPPAVRTYVHDFEPARAGSRSCARSGWRRRSFTGWMLVWCAVDRWLQLARAVRLACSRRA